LPLSFPKTILVPSIAHSERPVGRYMDKARPPYIEFSKKECARLDDDTLRFAVYHELGHWFRLTHVPKELLPVFPPLGSEDHEECFADNFAMYFMNHISMTFEHPEAEEVVATFLTTHEQEVRDFAEEVLARLKGELAA
jgi:hypothetical protein